MLDIFQSLPLAVIETSRRGRTYRQRFAISQTVSHQQRHASDMQDVVLFTLTLPVLDIQ